MPTVAELIKDRVSLEISCVDRVYLNAYYPSLLHGGQLVNFLRKHLGQQIPSPAVLQRMGRDFEQRVKAYAERYGIPIVHFEKGRRKDEVAAWYRSRFKKQEGVVFIGVAQEKAYAFKAKKQCEGKWVHFDYSRQSVRVNHYYFYLQDRQFGPIFIKVCSYAPWGMKLCLNGHEWVKCQARRKGLRFESLDNGFLWCADAGWLQRICHQLDGSHIEVMFDRWLRRLPLPLGERDFAAGYYPRLSIWQMEVSLTQVFERPVLGREFFEQVIRENLDLGRPDRVQLVFAQRVNRRTRSEYRTRVIERGVAPTIHISFKHSDLKQYFKEFRALRTELTVNDTYDFGIRRGVKNFVAVRKLGEQVNRRLLGAEQVHGGAGFSRQTWEDLIQPTVTAEGVAAPALKFGDGRVMALFSALGGFQYVVDGFTNRSLRERVAALLGVEYGSAQMTYDLRRLRGKGLVCRFKGRNRYVLSPQGRRVIYTLLKIYTRLVRPALPAWSAKPLPAAQRTALSEAFDALDRAFENMAPSARQKAA